MALKAQNMYKTVIGNTDLSLTAGPDESFRVKDIFIANPGSNYLTVYIEKATVGYFRIGGTLGNHLPFPNGVAKHAHNWTTSSTSAGDQTSFVGLEDAGGVEIAAKMIGGLSADTTYYKVGSLETTPGKEMKTLLGLLRDLGLFNGYPVASGQTFSLSGAKGSNAVQMVVYDVYDPGDVRPDEPNGSASAEYLYINYGDAGSNINTDGDTRLTHSLTPAEFPDFPFGAVVPAQRQIEVIGILASTFAPKENDGTNYCYTKYLKLMRERTVLFDEDRNGLLFYDPATTVRGHVDRVGEGYSLIGNFSDVDYRPPLLFDPPLVFSPGEELSVILTTEKGGSGQNIATDEHQVGFILRVRPSR